MVAGKCRLKPLRFKRITCAIEYRPGRVSTPNYIWQYIILYTYILISQVKLIKNVVITDAIHVDICGYGQ